MADSSSESSDDSDSSSLKHISSPLFNIPGFFVRFGAKVSPESDSGKSPTSPLDFGVLTNFSGLFSPRSPVCSSPKTWRSNKWDCSKVGLSIVNSLANETEAGNDDLDDLPKKKNLVLAPQVKIKILESLRSFSELLGRSLKLNSLPKNYSASSLSDTTSHLHELGDSTDVRGDERTVVEPSSSVKPSSSPMNIVSAREMTLSEDYTCIISHGPNPKTTHIFGDQVLECDPNELERFDTQEEAKSHKENSPPNPFVDFLSYCVSCKKNLQDAQDIYIHRGEKAFCSFGCQSDEIFAEEEPKISPGSSFHEDVFPMGMPLNS